MKFLLSMVVLIATVIFGSKLFSKKIDFSMGITNILFTGVEYIFLGIVLGPLVLNILDKDSLLKFQPFLIFGLSWIGFLFGIQFEFKLLKKLPKRFFSFTLIQAVVTFISVFSAVYFLLIRFSDFSKIEITVLALFLSSIAISTAPSALSIVNRNYKFKNQKFCDLMRYISSVDSLFSILFFSFLVSYLANGDFPDFSMILIVKWIFLTLMIGIFPSLIFSYLLKSTKNHNGFIALLIGIIAFTGGLAFQFNHSSLVSGFVGGIVIANLCRKRLDAILLLQDAEKPIYILIILLLGASLKVSEGFNVLLFFLFFLSRVTGKISGNFLAAKILKTKIFTRPTMGVALLSEGGIGFAILIDFYLLFPEYSSPILIIVILSAIINEFISPKLILTQFKEKKLIAKKMDEGNRNR